MVTSLHPALPLLLGAALLAGLRGRARTPIVLAAPLLCLALIWMLPAGAGGSLAVAGYDLTPLRVDATARVFATAFALAAALGGLFALRSASTVELAAAFAYAGGAVGVAFSGDLITLMVFWELMAVFSTLVIWSAGTQASYRAGMRYVGIHMIGGVLLMAGIAGHIQATGNIAFDAIPLEGLAGVLMLAGLLINAGAPPLSAWVGDAYPAATPTGTIFLSAFTTKSAVYALLRMFPGEDILIPFGLAMAIYGMVYAVLENDIRRVLVYSIVNQVGFMLVGVGIGTPLALNGVVAHAFAHIIYKVVLLMSAATVIQATGEQTYTRLGGLGRALPFTTACAVIGALSISAFPLTSGFVTKTMIGAAAGREGLFWSWVILLTASTGAMVYVGARYPWLVFFERRDHPPRAARAPDLPMRLAMGLAALICIGVGVLPELFYTYLPFATDYQAYTAGHVVSELQLLVGSALVFFVTLPLLRPREGVILDVDWLWRRPLPALCHWLATDGARIYHTVMSTLRRSILWLMHCVTDLHRPAGLFGRNVTTSVMAWWVAMLLGGYLFFYYG